MKKCLLMIGAILFFFSGCGNTETEADKSSPDTTLKHAAKEQVMIPATQTPRPILKDSTRHKIKQAIRIFEVFPMERVIRIRGGEDIVAEVHDIAFVKDNMFISDELQRKIFMLDLDGNIIKTVGARGDGPGEYHSPRYVAAIWGNQLAVLDAARRLLIFDAQGNHVLTLAGNVPKFTLPGRDFAWPTKNRLFATQFKSNDPDAKMVRIMDHSDLQNPVAVADFEDRIKGRQFINATLPYPGFELVEDTIWSAVMHDGQIHVFDIHGTSVRNLSLQDPDAIKPEDFETATRNSKDANTIFKAVRDKVQITYMSYVAGVVVVQTTKGLKIFDANGTLLSGNLYLEIKKVLGVYQNSIVTEIEVYSREESPHRYDGIPSEFKAMVELGFNFDEPEDDIYLRFGKVVE